MASVVGNVLLTVVQFLVGIAVFVVLSSVIPTDSRENKLVIAASVVFAVGAVTWTYWRLQDGGWGISRAEYVRRKEELDDDGDAPGGPADRSAATTDEAPDPADRSDDTEGDGEGSDREPTP